MFFADSAGGNQPVIPVIVIIVRAQPSAVLREVSSDRYARSHI